MAEEKVLEKAEPIAETGKLFLRNLWYSVTEEELTEIFGKIGADSFLFFFVSFISFWRFEARILSSLPTRRQDRWPT